jgi:predicted NAD/FAD-dependent oxidoreductase
MKDRTVKQSCAVCVCGGYWCEGGKVKGDEEEGIGLMGHISLKEIEQRNLL